jgi:hypothetical protein
MNNFRSRQGFRIASREIQYLATLVSTALFAFAVFAGAPLASAQVAPSAYRAGDSLSVGGAIDASREGYADHKLLGASVWVDANLTPHYGAEAEITWMNFHQQQNLHYELYMGGPRYSFRDFGRWRPYAKFLVGNGQFNFPFNEAHGGYLVLAPGGGVEFRLTPKWRLRVADFEYQDWPQFTYGSISSWQGSAGIRYTIR